MQAPVWQTGGEPGGSVGFCHARTTRPDPPVLALTGAPLSGVPSPLPSGPLASPRASPKAPWPNKPRWGLQPGPRPPPCLLLLHCGRTGPSCFCTPGAGRMGARWQLGPAGHQPWWGALGTTSGQSVKACLGQGVAGRVCLWRCSALWPSQTPGLFCEPAPRPRAPLPTLHPSWLPGPSSRGEQVSRATVSC